MSADPERLYQIIASQRFLSMEGLGNEVPVFIQTYSVDNEDYIRSSIHALATRLRNHGLEVADLDLFDLFLEELNDEGIKDAFIEGEREFDRRELLGDLQNHAAATRLVPRMAKHIESQKAGVTLLSGAGRIFPFLRAHTLLDAMQPSMMKHPIILFYPGEYIQIPGKGSQLRLFGTMPGEGYYRAFNLNNYKI
jgi:hypothetical protein